MAGLRKRTRLFSPAQIRAGHNLMRGFHARQRDHAPKTENPKPRAT